MSPKFPWTRAPPKFACEDFVAVQEVGKVINPVLAAGQIEGGVAQGIGFALYENVVWQEGRMVNASDDELHHAHCDGCASDPRLFRELPYACGPAGAKGIGELPLDGTAPAISMRLRMQLASESREIPMTPETLLELLAACRAKRLPRLPEKRPC